MQFHIEEIKAQIYFYIHIVSTNLFSSTLNQSKSYIKIFDSMRWGERGRFRDGELRDEFEREKKKKGKDVESQTRKILLLKMLQFIVARWSHPRRIAVAFREVYLHFAKQNACLPCPFSPSPPLFLYYSHEVHTLSVRSAFCRQRAQRVNKKKGHSFRPFWRRWDANTAVSFSLVLFFFFPPYSSADIYPFSISMTLNLSSR